MLAANTLIHRYGDGAEEYAATQLWDATQKQDDANASRWQRHARSAEAGKGIKSQDKAWIVA